MPSAVGKTPIGMPSEQPVTGDREHLSAGMRNPAMSVARSPFGPSASKRCLPASSRHVFPEASETSPAHELCLRFFFGLRAARTSSRMILRTVHSPASMPSMLLASGSRRRHPHVPPLSLNALATASRKAFRSSVSGLFGAPDAYPQPLLAMLVAASGSFSLHLPRSEPAIRTSV